MSAYRSILLLSLLCTGLLSLLACSQKETVTFKIMSYNIRHGVGLDTILDLSRPAGIIRSQSPDLCGLQEVDKYCRRSDSTDQTVYLAEQTGLTGTFGKFMNYQEGEYGMATLSDLPLVSSKVVPLPDGKYEPRSSLVHEVEVSQGHSLVFANVHFDWIAGEEGMVSRLKQAKALANYIDALGKASIIVGDFNCTPDSPTMQYFAEQGYTFAHKGADSLSFQGAHKAELDHLIFRNSSQVTFKYKKVRLLEAPIESDHRPLLVEIEVTIN
ncbi:endonuclease/exonuclease/phosphatase family protein [uncultured Eudoraea sp.]|uniref:endonuclease/exonuclease/phosphatase family protein n=1 Tax=uncultured Eudoraea sp. TaxID=1035614 RepID=UPI0026245DE0|nr:endonuclease/exonuclease/phosphatase family protein [uncultured Eudoraea sp.]